MHELHCRLGYQDGKCWDAVSPDLLSSLVLYSISVQQISLDGHNDKMEALVSVLGKRRESFLDAWALDHDCVIARRGSVRDGLVVTGLKKRACATNDDGRVATLSATCTLALSVIAPLPLWVREGPRLLVLIDRPPVRQSPSGSTGLS